MYNTVDERNPAPPGMVIKPCKYWDKLPTSTGDRRISHPSTVDTQKGWVFFIKMYLRLQIMAIFFGGEFRGDPEQNRLICHG